MRREAALEQWHAGVALSARGPIILGLAFGCIGGFAVRAGLAPLQGAVAASGTFVATGQNKLVQHLEGGIIRDLLVNEGDLVDANQVLVRMDDTRRTPSCAASFCVNSGWLRCRPARSRNGWARDLLNSTRACGERW